MVNKVYLWTAGVILYSVLYFVGSIFQIVLVLGTLSIFVYHEISQHQINKLFAHAARYQPNCLSPWSQKKFLVICNPISGVGNARIYVDKLLIPMLNSAQIFHEIIYTQRAGHAYQIVNSAQLKDYCGIIILGGDGTLHEIINGLANRVSSPEDFKDILSTLVLGVIPVGTANGFSASMGFTDCFQSIKQIIIGKVQTVDLFLVQDEVGNRKWESTLISWGNIADFDYLTEGIFRWLGPLKEVVVAPFVLWVSRSYRGTLTYDLNTDPKIETDVYNCIIGTNVPKITSDIIISEGLKPGQGVMDLIAFRKVPFLEWLSTGLAFSNSKHLEKKGVSRYRTQEWSLELRDGRLSIGGQNWVCKKIHVKLYPTMAQFICS